MAAFLVRMNQLRWYNVSHLINQLWLFAKTNVEYRELKSQFDSDHQELEDMSAFSTIFIAMWFK